MFLVHIVARVTPGNPVRSEFSRARTYPVCCFWLTDMVTVQAQIGGIIILVLIKAEVGFRILMLISSLILMAA